LKFDEELEKLADEQNFHLDGYSFQAFPEQIRPPRIVRVAAIQNQIVEPTTAPVEKQRDAIHERVGKLIEVAASGGANIICLQEAWS
jgi:beta-ureidopropionase